MTVGPQAAKRQAVFTEGPILRHVAVMTATACVGLMSLFVVDLLSIFYVARLGDQNAVAAVGYASQLTFFIFSVTIGMSIGIGAVVSRALGAADRSRARRLAGAGIVITASIVSLLVAAAYPFRHHLLAAIGARGTALQIGATFLAITLPANTLMAVGVVQSAILRAVGDARRAMYVTLAGAVATAFTDPLLIFACGFGVYGAAIALVISRGVFVIVGVHGAVRVHDMLAAPSLADIRQGIRPLMAIAAPAVLTNLATPVAGVFTTRIFATFGQATVAGMAIMDRIVPVAFGALFALSGAVGPIIGQNVGAGRFDRVRRTLDDSFTIVLAYVTAVWLVLFLMSGVIADAFAAGGDTARIIHDYCTFGAAAWVFLGWLFVANAAFNNLDFALLSTAFNWGRTTLGTIPFVLLGAHLFGADGALWGIVAGAALFGITSLIVAHQVVARLERRRAGL